MPILGTDRDGHEILVLGHFGDQPEHHDLLFERIEHGLDCVGEVDRRTSQVAGTGEHNAVFGVQLESVSEVLGHGLGEARCLGANVVEHVGKLVRELRKPLASEVRVESGTELGEVVRIDIRLDRALLHAAGFHNHDHEQSPFADRHQFDVA